MFMLLEFVSLPVAVELLAQAGLLTVTHPTCLLFAVEEMVGLCWNRQSCKDNTYYQFHTTCKCNRNRSSLGFAKSQVNGFIYDEAGTTMDFRIRVGINGVS